MTTDLAFEIDINHPAVGAALVKRKQAGSFPVDKVQKVLMDAGVPDALLPKAPTMEKALHRAMEDACKRDSTREVKVTGRKGVSVFTIVRTDKEKLDRNVHEGKGVSDAELTGKMEYDDNGNYSVKLTPSDHPSVAYIREKVEYHTGQFSNTYDLGVWIGQKLMPYAGAVQTGSGDYYLPKGDGFDLVNRVKAAFATLNTSGEYVRFYILPQLKTFEDTVDAITDSLLDEVDRVCRDIEDKLQDTEKKNTRKGLATMTERANRLRDTIDAFSKSLGAAFEDLGPRLDEVDKHIGIAEMHIEAQSNTGGFGGF